MMILQTKLLLGAAGLLGVTAFTAVKQHDARVAWEALAKERADSLAAKDKSIAGLIRGIVLLDSAAAKARQRYAAGSKKLADSLVRLDHQIDSLASSVPDSSPDKPAVTAIVKACNLKVDAVTGRLAACDQLRADDSVRIAKRDQANAELIRSRDGWKKQYEESSKRSGQPSWLVNLKVLGGVALGLVVGHSVR